MACGMIKCVNAIIHFKILQRANVTSFECEVLLVRLEGGGGFVWYQRVGSQDGPQCRPRVELRKVEKSGCQQGSRLGGLAVAHQEGQIVL